MKIKLSIYLLTIVISLVSLVSLMPFFDELENRLYDYRFRSKYYGKSQEGSITDIVITDIDERTNRKLGKYSNWSREYFSQTLEVLAKKRAKVTAFDLLFDESRFVSEDSIFKNSIENYGRTVTGFNFSDPDEYNFLYPDSVLKYKSLMLSQSFIDKGYSVKKKSVVDIGSELIANSSSALGFLNIYRDNDGVIRKAPLFTSYLGRIYPSFALKTLMKYYEVETDDLELIDGKSLIIHNAKTGDNLQDITIPLTDDNMLLINYKGTWKTFRTVPFYDVMFNRVGRRTFENKIVLVGASLRGLMDLRSTPVQTNMPGVEVHANIINTILTQDFLTLCPKYGTVLLMTGLILLTVTVIFLFSKIIYPLIMALLTLYFYVELSFYLFNEYGIITDISRPVIAVVFTFITGYIIKYYLEQKDKDYISKTLGKYVSPNVSEIMLSEPELLKLGGERKNITMFFSDIRNFTTISENLPPDEVVSFLNVYLSEMTDIVKKNRGTLDKFMGDAVICLFGAPLDTEHASDACNCAINMINKSEEIGAITNIEEFKNFKIGIGINTGEVTVGNIGSDELFDYTAIGNEMNTASRLENLNKYYGTSIIISEETKNSISDKFITRLLDVVRVKGKKNPVKIYELLHKDMDNKFLELYHKGMMCYFNNNLKEAKNIFSECLNIIPDDSPSKLFIDRANYYIENQDKFDDGVHSFTEK